MNHVRFDFVNMADGAFALSRGGAFSFPASAVSRIAARAPTFAAGIVRTHARRLTRGSLAVLPIAALLLSASPSEAQVRPAPRNWINAYGLLYTGLSRIDDPGTGDVGPSRWAFGDNAFGFGGGYAREFGQGLLLGADLAFARPEYERRDLDDLEVVLARGNASVLTAMLTGRLATGGAADLGFYLVGGLGTIAYRLADIGAWNSDFALRAGTGIDYRFRRNMAAHFEWSRIWGYHEQEDIGGGTAQHSMLRLGLRYGL